MVKKLKKFIIAILFLVSTLIYSQPNGLIISDTVGDPDINESAIFELISTDKGVLISRLTSVQRDGITVGATQNGLVIFNTDIGRFQYYLHSLPGWVTLIPNGLSGTGDNNQIAFFTGGPNSTSLTSNSGFVFDASSTFLGIGTESPQYTLDVNGDARVGGEETSGTIVITSNQNPVDYEARITASPVSTEDVVFILPPNNGTSGWSLITDGNGNLSWSDTPEINQEAINTNGTEGGILFNNSGTLTTAELQIHF